MLGFAKQMATRRVYDISFEPDAAGISQYVVSLLMRPGKQQYTVTIETRDDPAGAAMRGKLNRGIHLIQGE